LLTPPGLDVKKAPKAIAGFSLYCLAIAAAFAAQRELTPLGHVPAGVGLYVVAVVLAIAGSSLIDRVAPVAQAMPDSAAAGAWRRNTHGRPRMNAAILLVVCAFACLTTSLLAVVHDAAHTALPLWLVSLVLLTLGFGMRTTFPWHGSLSRAQAWELLAVVAVVALAFALRFPHLTMVPPDVHGDEAAVGLEARRILTGEAANVFGLGWANLPELSFAASSLSLKAFGNDLFGLRMASVVQGCLAVALLYGVAKRLLSRRIAAMAAVLMAVSQMAIHYSRDGNNYIGALFASLLLFYFLLRGLSLHHPIDFLFAGFATGLTLSVYYPARLTPILAILYCAARAVSDDNFLRTQWRGLIALTLGAFFFLAPQAVTYAPHPLSGFDRASAVFVLRPDNLAHEYDGYKVHSLSEVLWRQTANTIGAFNLRGETSEQYSQRAPLLDFWSGALFALGAAVAVVRVRNPSYILLSSWLLLTLVMGSVLTVDALSSPRIVSLLGILAIVPAFAIDVAWRGAAMNFGRWGGRTFAALVVGFGLVVGRENYIDYFSLHAKMAPASFFTLLSQYVAQINDQYQVYLLADADTSLRYDTARFLLPNIDGVDVRDLPLPLPLDPPPRNKGVVFVARSLTDRRLPAIRAHYPGGIEEVHYNASGAPEFDSYRVEHHDLLQPAGTAGAAEIEGS
jgi:4-amino-4-deoxy-L-arabinose transferase-like glycosyltransferase